MDKNSMEFWGNYLLSAARGQQNLEDMAKWFQQGFHGFENLTEMFGKAYGLNQEKEGSPDYLGAWMKAQEDFRKSFSEFFSLVGFVSPNEHLELVKKYEELKEKAASQEETIKHLRMLLTEATNKEYREASKQFDDLVQKQSEQFQEVMEQFGQIFKTNDEPPANEG